MIAININSHEKFHRKDSHDVKHFNCFSARILRHRDRVTQIIVSNKGHN